MDKEQLQQLEEGAALIGLRLDADKLRLLGRHIDLLLKWNKSINLTAITDPSEMVEKHVLDSLAVVPFVPSGSLLDAGSGAGFPGLPIGIARPDLDVVLVDSVQKKVAFLKNALAELKQPRIRAFAVRLQGDPASENLPRVHCAVARAYAAPQQWLALADSYVLPGGIAVCMLGPSDEVPDRVGELRLEKQLAYQLPFSKAERRLAIYRHT